MADIGSTLRETRIRKKIDITSVEEATKIRAKYLRALENEEFGLLPGPTYAKTFLRTYAEYLGLDPRLLVEQYSARFERPEDLELPAFSREERLRTRVTRVPPPSRWGLVLGGIVVILAFLFVLGLTGGDDDGDDGKTRSTAERQREGGRQATGGASAGSTDREQPQRKTVRVRLVAARPVWVCLVDAKGNDRIGGQTVAAGEQEGPFRSSAFEVTIGNGGGDLVIDGKRRDTPEVSEPVGYSIKPSGIDVLPASERPTCD
jgi:transcriptional regulator with XRE-family HTH domain